MFLGCVWCLPQHSCPSLFNHTTTSFPPHNPPMSETRQDACRHAQQCNQCRLWHCADDEMSYCSVCWDLDDDVLCFGCAGAGGGDPRVRLRRICETCWERKNAGAENLVGGRRQPIQIKCDVCEEERQLKVYQQPRRWVEEEGPCRWACVACLNTIPE